MRTSLNTQARLERALRNNYTVLTVWETFRTFKWFTIAIVTLMPIYPSLSVLGSPSESQVGEYDESTIITAYDEGGADSPALALSDNGLIKTEDEDFSLNTKSTAKPQPALATIEEPTPAQPIATQSRGVFHTVKAGESLGRISDKYNISTDSILWANDMAEGDTISPGMTLRIPPVSGVVYTVRKGDTLSDISTRYGIDVDDIVRVNNLVSAAAIREGRDIMIPGAVKKAISAPKAAIAALPAPKSNIIKVAPPKPTVKYSPGEVKDRYAIKYTGNRRGFAWGNCTAYVAMNKNVTWRGNANQWLKNARAAGVATGSRPVPGAIIQFTGRGYNRYYGHVGIVVDVTDDHIVVKDMNYRKINEVTIRKISKTDSTINGYIYVD